MRAIFLSIALFLMVVGCKPALKTAYGIKKPKLESQQSIKKYLVKRKIDTSNVYVLKDINAFVVAGQQNILTIPDAIFFNRKGNLVRYKKATEDCNAKVGDFLSELGNFSSQPEDHGFTMDQLMLLLKGKPIDQKADVNVFITWTVYGGRLNKTKAFEWIHLIDKAKANGISANWYLLNCDFQESWNLSREALDKLGIKH